MAVLVAAARLRPVAVALVVSLSRAWPTISSSCRRSTPSPSPIPRTSSRCSSSCRRGHRQHPDARACAPRPIAARREARTTAELYVFSRKLAGVVDARRSAVDRRHQIASTAEAPRSSILLPERTAESGIAVRAGYPPEASFNEADLAAARWAWEHEQRRRPRRRHAARPAAVPADAHRPRRRRRRRHRRERPGALLTPDQRRLLDALADQAALAIERIKLADDIDRGAAAAPSPSGCARRC